MIEKKLKDIVLQAYGIAPHIEEKICFICKMFNEERGPAINAHSISRGHNLKDKKWLTFRHSGTFQKNKEYLTDINTFAEVKPKSASVSLSVCDYHDKRFNIFEQNNIVDYESVEHLNLLRMRSMLYFYYTYHTDLINLKNRKKHLNKNKKFFELLNSNKYYKECHKNLNVRASKKNIQLNELKELPFLIKNYWEDTSTTFFSNEYEKSIFLEQTESIIILPLKNNSPILGSFFITKEDLLYLDNFNQKLPNFINAYEMLDNEEYLDGDNFLEIESETPLLFFNIINNNNNPFILIMGNSHRDNSYLLMKIFQLLLFSQIQFNYFLSYILFKNKNIYFEDSFISNFSPSEKNTLINFHNNDIKVLPDNISQKITKYFFYDLEKAYFKDAGFRYKTYSVIESIPSIEVLNFEVLKDCSNIHISWNFRLGNGNSFTDTLSLLAHDNYENEQLSLSVKRNSSEDFLSYEFFKIEIIVQSEVDYLYEVLPEELEDLLPEDLKFLTLYKRKILNSKLGEIYYDFLNDLPYFIEQKIKEELSIKLNKKIDKDDLVDVLDVYDIGEFDFIKFLIDYSSSKVQIIDSTVKTLFIDC